MYLFFHFFFFFQGNQLFLPYWRINILVLRCDLYVNYFLKKREREIGHWQLTFFGIINGRRGSCPLFWIAFWYSSVQFFFVCNILIHFISHCWEKWSFCVLSVSQNKSAIQDQHRPQFLKNRSTANSQEVLHFVELWPIALNCWSFLRVTWWGEVILFARNKLSGQEP